MSTRHALDASRVPHDDRDIEPEVPATTGEPDLFVDDLVRFAADAPVEARPAVDRHMPRAALSKRVYWPRNTSRLVPIGPERCFATITSAEPLSGESGWYTSSR